MYVNKGNRSMLRLMCKGKIHRATVTEADPNYVGPPPLRTSFSPVIP